MYTRAEWLIDHRAETHAPVAIMVLRAIDGLLEGSSQYARRAMVKFRLANFLAWGTGDLEAAQAACAQAHELFCVAGDERQALLATRELAWIKGLRGHLTAIGEDAEGVVRAAEARGDRFVVMQGLSAVGYSANFRGALAEGEAALRRAVTIAREDDKSYRLTVALGVSPLALLSRAASLRRQRCSRRRGRSNPAYRESILIELETLVAWIGGWFPSAVTMASEAVAWMSGTTARRRTFGMVFGALAAIEVDDVAVAERLLGRCATCSGIASGRSSCPCCTTVRRWWPGTLATRPTASRLRSAAARLLEIEARSWGTFALFDLAELAADADDAAAAAVAAEELHGVAGFVELPLYQGLATAAAGWASVAAGEPDRAVEPARAAVRLLGGTGCRALLGRAHHLLGRALPPEGRSDAIAALERSASIFEQCGSTWRRARSLDSLRRLGTAGRRAAAAALGPASLTRRELEVARLAAAGMSARDIAQTLFVGERTVESHLASVYAKLGVKSKLQLVRRAAELGLS